MLESLDYIPTPWGNAAKHEGSGSVPLDSPNFTGIPTAPTAAPGTNTTQIATTEFVTYAITLTGITINDHISLTSAHGATSSNTASKIVLRDENGDFSAGTITVNKALIANTFIDTGVWLTTQEGFLITTDIPVINVMTFLEFTMHGYMGGYPAMGVVQCYPYTESSAILQPKYTAIGNAPPYCRIFYSNSKLCFWFPSVGNYTTMHPVLHTNGGGYKILSTTEGGLPSSRNWEVTANVLLPWSSINDGSGSGLDADLLDGLQGSAYAKVNTATTPDATDLPVGSYIVAQTGYTGTFPLNSSQLIGLNTSGSIHYFTDPNSFISKPLSGTWRVCGRMYSSSGMDFYLMRRVE